MMDRVVSSMNSTRTWVTPPREPSFKLPSQSLFSVFPSIFYPVAGGAFRLTGAAEDLDDLDELDSDFGRIHVEFW
jgi:hypothetical protein